MFYILYAIYSLYIKYIIVYILYSNIYTYTHIIGNREECLWSYGKLKRNFNLLANSYLVCSFLGSIHLSYLFIFCGGKCLLSSQFQVPVDYGKDCSVTRLKQLVILYP